MTALRPVLVGRLNVDDAHLGESGGPGRAPQAVQRAHAGIPDPSEMSYLGDGEWVRLDPLPTVVGDLMAARGMPSDPNVKRVNNGITGDAGRSSKELGTRALFDNKVEHAVRQIKPLIPQ